MARRNGEEWFVGGLSGLETPRERYHALLQSPDYIEKILREGAIQAREYSVSFLQQIRRAIGIRSLNS